MNLPPTPFGEDKVVMWSVIDDRHRHTHSCRHVLAGELQEAAAGLAICKSDEEGAYYLFGCDAEWNTITDTWHETLADAIRQAESEYAGIQATWNTV